MQMSTRHHSTQQVCKQEQTSYKKTECAKQAQHGLILCALSSSAETVTAELGHTSWCIQKQVCIDFWYKGAAATSFFSYLAAWVKEQRMT